jgi:hypothetical protein
LIDGDPDRAVALCDRAFAVDEVTAGVFGRVVAVAGHMGAGRNDAAAAISTELRAVLTDLTDPVDRHLAAFAILTTQDPDTIERDAETALAAARAVGAPLAIADVLRSASTRWYFSDPPDFDRVFAEINEAIRLHEAGGAPSIWEWMVLTWARTFAEDAHALDTLRQAVVRLYDGRHWGALDGTLEAAPVLLARHAPAAAATIHGHLEGSEPPWGQSGLDLRGKAAEVVAAIPDNDVHRARGAAMDRHEIVALSLAALAAD